MESEGALASRSALITSALTHTSKSSPLSPPFRPIGKQWCLNPFALACVPAAVVRDIPINFVDNRRTLSLCVVIVFKGGSRIEAGINQIQPVDRFNLAGLSPQYPREDRIRRERWS